MKVSMVSSVKFNSNSLPKENMAVDPYLYTASYKENGKELNKKNFRIFLGSLATLAVGITLYKIFGKKIL